LTLCFGNQAFKGSVHQLSIRPWEEIADFVLGPYIYPAGAVNLKRPENGLVGDGMEAPIVTIKSQEA
jgi:hypothetical protein